MRIPFLSKSAPGSDFRPIVPFKTPDFRYTPSDTLQLIVHLPANGFVHLQPPLDRTDIPGQYDHILKGDLEIIAPNGWDESVQSITVGVKALSKLYLVGREGEVDVLFERHVTIDQLSISAGSQKFTFDIILPSTLTVQTFHDRNKTSVRAYAQLISTSDHPPKTIEARDDFEHDNTPTPTSIQVAGSTVTYGSSTRMRIGHMTERDADFVTLDRVMQGIEEGLGVYDIRVLSDIWSVAGPYHFSIKLPSLSPLMTIFYIRLVMVQTTRIQSPRDPDIPPLLFTDKIVLTELGEHVPTELWNPGNERTALWRGSGAGGKGGSGGYEKEVSGILPFRDTKLRASTVPGTITPINTQHALSVEIVHSVYGQFANGRLMSPQMPGQLRYFRRTEGIILPTCVNIPGILHLPTYEESSRDQGEGFCACQLPEDAVMLRFKKYVESLRLADKEREDIARAKDKQAAG